MIVLQIHIYRIFTFKLERNTPVCGYRHSIAAFTPTFELMEPKARHIHIFRPDTTFQSVEQAFNSRAESRRNAPMVSIGVKFPQSFVTNRSDQLAPPLESQCNLVDNKVNALLREGLQRVRLVIRILCFTRLCNASIQRPRTALITVNAAVPYSSTTRRRTPSSVCGMLSLLRLSTIQPSPNGIGPGSV